MRISLCFRVFFIPLLLIFLGIDFLLVSGQCLNDQRSILVQFKNNLQFNSSLSSKLLSWNQSTDCCTWGGVNCNTVGQVIGLDLNNESISGVIDSSSRLFGLKFLQRLNLANNKFNLTVIPSGLGNLTRLAYLNLSSSGFVGQIPGELSQLTRLVTLDLSNLYFLRIIPLKLENPNLAMLVQNFTNLIELHLDGVNISTPGDDWCRAISSSLLNLRVLSLSNCYLSGPIDESLLKLRSLSVIRLAQNNLSAAVPESFSSLTNLTVLLLSSCKLNGKFPGKILQVPTLGTLDLSSNNELQGSLPPFPKNGSLQTLLLGFTNFSGEIPASIGNLGMLSRLGLQKSNFSGRIPPSMANLTQLSYLDLSSNNFIGPIPSFQLCKNLTHIDLSRNGLSGSITSSHFEDLQNLVSVDLRFNAFSGRIPSSLFSLQLLQKIQLSNNNFTGQLNISNLSSSLLDTLDLGSNNLEGPLPRSFFELGRLNILLLSSNNFSGRIQIEDLLRLGNLTNLDLSYNSLSIDTSNSSSSLSHFPHITTLKLAKCNLQKFPNLRNQSRLDYLDLSDNQIGGEVPNWIWDIGNKSLSYLNLSRNQLVSLQEPYIIPYTLSILDLHSNQLSGEIPLPPLGATYVDYSANNFSSPIPDAIGNNLSFAYFFSVANNKLTGKIPDSICNALYLQVLDLSNNSLGSTIPSCLIEWSGNGSGIGTLGLGVLNLGKNNLSGTIEGTFLSNCGLKTLDLHGNRLDGKVPESLANCTMLEVLNLGNNKINDKFPCFLKNNTNLRVLVLRSNMLYGGIRCPKPVNSWEKLQIIDIASNKFSGDLLPDCFTNWRGMMIDEDGVHSEVNHLHSEVLQMSGFYYQDMVTVTFKGLELELVKILTLFTSIDISSNSFDGEIPNTIGQLQALFVLNVSHNAFTGPIPPSIGNLSQLESLDLSMNKLTGEIPIELVRLTFLSSLNLSFNQLEGTIPMGSQFLTFAEDSFIGNKGLCGSPLNKSCNGPLSTSPPQDSNEFDWQFILTGLGFGVGAGLVIGPLVFWKQGRYFWNRYTDKLVDMILLAFGFKYTCDIIYEARENIKEETEDDADESDKEKDELEGQALRGRYCVFCTKLDFSRKKAIHDPKCTCHNSTPTSIFSSSSSSSSCTESPFTNF